MLYADYKFFIDDTGLKMADSGYYSIKIDKIPLNEGDMFILETTEDGRLFFKLVDKKEEYLFSNTVI